MGSEFKVRVVKREGSDRPFEAFVSCPVCGQEIGSAAWWRTEDGAIESAKKYLTMHISKHKAVIR